MAKESRCARNRGKVKRVGVRGAPGSAAVEGKLDPLGFSCKCWKAMQVVTKAFGGRIGRGHRKPKVSNSQSPRALYDFSIFFSAIPASKTAALEVIEFGVRSSEFVAVIL